MRTTGLLLVASSCVVSAFVPAPCQRGQFTQLTRKPHQGACTLVDSRPLYSTTEGQEVTPTPAAPEVSEAESLKGWTVVWQDANTLPAEEHSQTPLILRSTTDKSYLKDRFFVLIRHKEGFKLLDASCGRCNFPLLNSPVVEEPALGEDDNAAIACKVCGMRHSLSTGKACKPIGAPLDLGQSVGNFFLKRGEYKNIESHPTRVTPDGKVYAKLTPRKEKRPTTDMIVL